MRNSTHYGLNLVEGNDIVNPLTQDVPNYEAIDNQMYVNESASVGTATELASGTIHAITRDKANCNMFRFTATSRFNAGDTFTVDGVSVTSVAPNGTSLGDGAYIVGGTVLCSLVGQLMTVYTNSIGYAENSKKLGGQLPEYYATKSALDSTNEVATSAAQLANTVASELFEVGYIQRGIFRGAMLANDVPGVVGEILLEPGKWIVYCRTHFERGAYGVRGQLLTTSQSVPYKQVILEEGDTIVNNTAGNSWNVNGVRILNVTSATNYYLQAVQTGGASGLNADGGEIVAIKIK